MSSTRAVAISIQAVSAGTTAGAAACSRGRREGWVTGAHPPTDVSDKHCQKLTEDDTLLRKTKFCKLDIHQLLQNMHIFTCIRPAAIPETPGLGASSRRSSDQRQLRKADPRNAKRP